MDADLSLFGIVYYISSHPQVVSTDRRNILARWCETIEMRVIKQQLNADVYSTYRPESQREVRLSRYQQMAQYAHAIHVFGETTGDFEALPGIDYLPLHPCDTLMREWFVVVQHPQYTAAVTARETSPPGTAYEDRTFAGIMTANSNIVELLARRLDEAIVATHST